MDFKDAIKQLADRVGKLKDNIQTEEATKNARAAAIKFAKDSDSELGKIKRAYQGQFSIEDRDANTPYIKRIRVVTTIDYSLED